MLLKHKFSDLLHSNSVFFQNLSIKKLPWDLFQISPDYVSTGSGKNTGHAAAISIELEVLGIPIHNNAINNE